MEQVTQFFKGLFSTKDWPARWHCGYWSDFHGWLYIVSDLAIWVAYFLIPLIILRYFLKKKTNIRFQAAYIYFALFILLCGATHFLDAMTFWIPMYRVNALVRFVTAIVSLLTVYYLVKMLPQISELKTTVELEREIGLRKAAEQKLAEANKGLEAFAAIASHDLQEPLRKIGVFTSLLKERNEKGFDKESLAYADKIVSSAERMRVLIQDVLTLSGLKQPPHLEVVALDDVIRQAADSLDLRVHERKASIHIQTGLPTVPGYENYLIQLFCNLLSNALKFTHKPPVIRVTGYRDQNHVWVSVSDNGIGIPEENYDKILLAFERLHSKAAFEGTGLGLAISKKIVDLHQGKMMIESNSDEGSVFTVRLPVVQS